MRIKLSARSALLVLACALFSFESLFAQFEDRFLDSRVHRNGKLWVGVTNFGQFGTDAGRGAVWPGTDIAGQEAQYINRGGMFFGGIVPSNETTGPDLNSPGDLDTLVAEGPSAWSVVDFREMAPHFPDQRSAIKVRSNNPNSEFFSPNAVSNEDFIATYTDTFLIEDGFVFSPPKHQRALGIEVEERSYQFSLTFAEDIVFFDLTVRNIGKNFIRNFNAGFFADNDMGVVGDVDQRDDASGFMEKNSAGETVNTAWVVEPDGDNGLLAGVVGVRVLRPTAREGKVSFNWWMSDTEISSKDDWGPVTQDVATGDPNVNDPIGSPEDDPQKYLLMTNGSFDPPQFDPATNEFNTDIPAGVTPNDNSRFLISFGPLGRDSTITDPNDPMAGQTIKIFAPGDSILFTYAVIGGEGNPDVARALGTFDPAAFIDLGINASIAGLMFDNPGFDTDGDGFAGEDLDGDGVLDTGDGVPDFRGPPPPPAPPLTVTLADRTVTLDWSAADPTSPGYDATDPTLPLNFEDPFVADDPETPENESQDFEGFRVLRSSTGVLGTFEILAEFDIGGNDFGRNTGLTFRFEDPVPNGKSFTYSVASFDRGAPQIGLETLASSPLLNAQRVSASPGPSTTLSSKIWVEPNPYVQRSGFEDALAINSDVLIELNREIHFVNVPQKCTIRIFTVDGDLVETILHDNPGDSRARWDLTSRNSRPIASGIYLFAVETSDGDRQIGRFVIIK